MGKCLYNNKIKLIIFILLYTMACVIPNSYASCRELELFDSGYEYYLSYRPKQSVETFNIFLKEFPDSFAKDAAMFWLGKSLICLKSFEEAKRVLSEIKLQIPDSPFIPYVNRELEAISRSGSEIYKEMSGEVQKGGMKQIGTNIADLQSKDKAIRDKEKEKSQRNNKPVIQNILGAKQTDTEKKEIIEKYIGNSSIAVTKLGIREILWRTGNDHEDFINEQILYNEAKKMNINVDMEKYKGLIEKYKLGEEEINYLNRYLIISELIDKKLKDMPGEKIIESLFVKYTSPEEHKRDPLAIELQKDAKIGRSFEDIYKSYPEYVKYSQIEFNELESNIKEIVLSLHNGEIITIWDKYGYRILKPIVKDLSYRPFKDLEPEIGDKIKSFVKDWINDLKNGKEGKTEFVNE